MKKIIVRIVGGIGNQLFCYAAAKRLALHNKAELVVDDLTGFLWDKYRRKYMLHKFNISARKANRSELLEPFSRARRYLIRNLSRLCPFENRMYIQQEGVAFDRRLLNCRVKGTVYLEGNWQSEDYFKDAEDIMRHEFKIAPPEDSVNMRISDQIRKSSSVALHVRWFHDPANLSSQHNIALNYYLKAIDYIEQRVDSPHYFLFSDNLEAAKQKLSLSNKKVTYVDNNKGDANAFADLWLMTHCKHYIIANSTFSWWGAWLGTERNKIVLAPGLKIGTPASWGFKGLLPETWLVI